MFNILLEACQLANYNILTSGKHIFYPQGLTAYVILSESHAAIHTYPEKEIVYMDVFTCGDKSPELAIDEFVNLTGGEIISRSIQDRDMIQST